MKKSYLYKLFKIKLNHFKSTVSNHNRQTPRTEREPCVYAYVECLCVCVYVRESERGVPIELGFYFGSPE